MKQTMRSFGVSPGMVRFVETVLICSRRPVAVNICSSRGSREAHECTIMISNEHNYQNKAKGSSSKFG